MLEWQRAVVPCCVYLVGTMLCLFGMEEKKYFLALVFTWLRPIDALRIVCTVDLLRFQHHKVLQHTRGEKDKDWLGRTPTTGIEVPAVAIRDRQRCQKEEIKEDPVR